MLSIPPGIRAAVDDRDLAICRVCGVYAGDARQLHHVHYGGDYVGMGGRRLHEVDNIVTLDLHCHGTVHSNKGLYLPLLERVIRAPGLTVFQLRRRDARRVLNAR